MRLRDCRFPAVSRGPEAARDAAWAAARAPDRQDHARVLRETAIADDGVVPTGELDHDLVPQDVGATDATRAARRARVPALVGRGPGCVRRSGGGCFGAVDRVAS